MKERPILFSAPMVRAILTGKKVQTRRIVKPQPPAKTTSVRTFHHIDPRPHFWANDGVALLNWSKACPFGEAGDRLWVRETFDPIFPQDPHYNGGRPIEYDYRATYKHGDRLGDLIGVKKTWKPAIHMPRAASRITLEVTGVRVERLQAISVEDAEDEGCKAPDELVMQLGCRASPTVFRQLWESINGPASWDANPWVWAITFKRVHT